MTSPVIILLAVAVIVASCTATPTPAPTGPQQSAAAGLAESNGCLDEASSEQAGPVAAGTALVGGRTVTLYRDPADPHKAIFQGADGGWVTRRASGSRMVDGEWVTVYSNWADDYTPPPPTAEACSPPANGAI